MAGVTKSVEPVTMPKDTGELSRITAQVGIDMLNFKREEKQVRAWCKVHQEILEEKHVQNRTAATRKALGEANVSVAPLPI